jgi:hypothetical protein
VQGSHKAVVEEWDLLQEQEIVLLIEVQGLVLVLVLVEEKWKRLVAVVGAVLAVLRVLRHVQVRHLLFHLLLRYHHHDFWVAYYTTENNRNGMNDAVSETV